MQKHMPKTKLKPAHLPILALFLFLNTFLFRLSYLDLLI